MITVNATVMAAVARPIPPRSIIWQYGEWDPQMQGMAWYDMHHTFQNDLDACYSHFMSSAGPMPKNTAWPFTFIDNSNFQSAMCYTHNLDTMHQTNLSTGEMKPMRRIQVSLGSPMQGL
jgi:hypothetical protein